MMLRRHHTERGARWSLDGRLLPPAITLEALLALPRGAMSHLLSTLPAGPSAEGAPLLASVDPHQEIWASGVTYLRSRDARKAESADADFYARVYDAERPEIFFKAQGWRAVGPGGRIRIRRDSDWNAPEPELVLVLNASMEIVGFTAGNDVSSRSIEGENPLYLPQAKSYDGSCAVGPAIVLRTNDDIGKTSIALEIHRDGHRVYRDETDTGQMKRSFTELAEALGRELSFPGGVLLMTGTSLVPPDPFSLRAGDRVTVRVGDLSLANEVARG